MKKIMFNEQFGLQQSVLDGTKDMTLPDYVNRLNSIDTRLLPYVEDAISNI